MNDPQVPILQQTQIDPFSRSANDLLNNLQANILKFHGRRYAWHVLLKFSDDIDTVKLWIRNFAGKITSAKEQLMAAGLRKSNPAYDGGTVICFFLSGPGYHKLKCKPEPIGRSVLKSMKQVGDILNDPDPSQWEPVFQEEIHAMVLLADNDPKILQQELDKLQSATNQGITVLLPVQKGEALMNNTGAGIEHFGFVDGISQPKFLHGEAVPGKIWDDTRFPLQLVLVEQAVPGYADCFGSFLVFRKLEQNVELFKKLSAELAEKLLSSTDKESAQKLAEAYIVGRFQNGTPVVKHDGAIPAGNTTNSDNDFDYQYDPNGSKCPFHSHIRAATPRDMPRKSLTRILRRGMPYDEAGRNNNLSWYPPKGVGLLFMCYQNDIPTQFEVIQADWSNNGTAGDKKAGIDGIIGQGEVNKVPQLWPAKWGTDERTEGFRFSGCVTLKGGEYFFCPSIPFLKTLI